MYTCSGGGVGLYCQKKKFTTLASPIRPAEAERSHDA